MTPTKYASDIQFNLIDRPQSSDSIAVPIGSAASIGNCFASWIAMRSNTQDTIQACREPSESSLKFFERAIDARRIIFHSGDRIEGIPIICSGWAAIVSTLPNNRRQIIAILLPGDLVLGALIFEDKLDVSVEAITDVTYRSFNRSEFRAEIFKNPGLLESTLKVWNEQSLQIVQLAASLGQCTAEERVAGLLMKLMERLTPLGMVTDHSFHFPLRQSHIAEITGLTPVHVSRVINLLRREGLIELSNRTLTVQDPAALERACNRKGAGVPTLAQQSA